MFKTAAVLITFVFRAADASTSKAQQLTTQKPRLSDNAWHNDGWGFAGPGVYNEKNPSIRKRLAGLLHMAHVHALAQLCPDIERRVEPVDPIAQHVAVHAAAPRGFRPVHSVEHRRQR